MTRLRSARRVCLALVLVLLSASFSRAQDGGPDPDAVHNDAAAAAAAGDLNKVRQVLGTLLAPGRTRSLDAHRSAARAADKFLPRPEANKLTAQLYAELIDASRFDLSREDRAQVWNEANKLYRRYLADLDVPAGAHLLRAWIAVQPAQPWARENLGLLYYEAGELELAYEVFDEFSRKMPSSFFAANWLAYLEQELDRPDEAIARRREIAERLGRPEQYGLIALQELKLGRTAAAAAALDLGDAVVGRMPKGEEQDRLREVLRSDREWVTLAIAKRDLKRRTVVEVPAKVRKIATGWALFLIAGFVLLRRRGWA